MGLESASQQELLLALFKKIIMKYAHNADMSDIDEIALTLLDHSGALIENIELIVKDMLLERDLLED
jgi:hypothetical protein